MQTRHEEQIVLRRRELEIAVLSHLAPRVRSHARSGNLPRRQQLLPWEQCETRLLEYCQALGLPDSAEVFVRQLKDSLTQVADKVDDSYPDNTELTLDEEGKPHSGDISTENPAIQTSQSRTTTERT